MPKSKNTKPIYHPPPHFWNNFRIVFPILSLYYILGDLLSVCALKIIKQIILNWNFSLTLK